MINPYSEDIIVDVDLQNPLKFHNLKSITPKWKPNGEFLYNDLLSQLFERLVSLFDIEISSDCKDKWRNQFYDTQKLSHYYFIYKYCQLNYPKCYA